MTTSVRKCTIKCKDCLVFSPEDKKASIEMCISKNMHFRYVFYHNRTFKRCVCGSICPVVVEHLMAPSPKSAEASWERSYLSKLATQYFPMCTLLFLYIHMHICYDGNRLIDYKQCITYAISV